MKTTSHPYLDNRAFKRYNTIKKFVFAPIHGLTTEPLYVYWAKRWDNRVSYKIGDWSKWYTIGSCYPFQNNLKVIGNKLMCIYASVYDGPHYGFSPAISIAWQENPRSNTEFNSGSINYVHPTVVTIIKNKP